MYIERLGNIKEGCRQVSLSRPKYYYKPKKDKLGDIFILEKIKDIAISFPSYGYRRITAALRREDVLINHKKVYRIMCKNGICCSIRRNFKATTNSNHDLAKYPNLVRNLITSRLDEVWHADITYIRFEASFAYLAAIIDGYSRKVVGYALGKTLSSALTIAALKDAIKARNTEDFIHHSDQGFQYCSSQYIKILKENSISISMSDKANPYDNAKMESFFRTLKVEEVYIYE
ncbi:MAG: IS3 family transposase [Clostridia bacterium]|nr:IS3 family transposase [Clostridia bacterium]